MRETATQLLALCLIFTLFYLQELCDPSAYVTMNDENMCKAYLHFKARAKTWSYDRR